MPSINNAARRAAKLYQRSGNIEELNRGTRLGLETPANLNLERSDEGGTIEDSTHLSYRVSAVDSDGNETLACPAEIITVLSEEDTGSVIVSWDEQEDAVHYRVYGRTADAEELLAEVDNGTYTDTGEDDPDGDLPMVNRTGGQTA